jgi:hypothetical protein
MEVEIWKDIEGFENKYQVSNLGNVRSLDRIDSIGRFKNGSIRKVSKEKDGYCYITLIGDKSKTKSFFVHRLVANHFKIKASDNLQVNHIDGNKDNNSASNLEWTTSQENVIHSLRLGLRKSGEDHPFSKLNNKQVLEIPNLLKIGYSQKKISDIYNVSYSTIKNICQKRK